ncbi:hypothetical protein HKM21_04700 [Longimicrobium terrae]|nr:hypothetical protein [Longimicrobium terrae]
MPIYRTVRFGQHRIRDGYLDIRTDSSHFSRPVTAAPQRIMYENPQWSGDMYRIRVMGEVLSLQFTVAPADAPIERTLLFQRDEFFPVD